ncbi:hypothetical protein B0A50_02826 [Salinomyces thailandicus]|uniref:Uncharacterized protein n=1 Tax=Salinomyces thailandicus TaxID=706561 RepID=A0A4U0U5B5_9PEZI|nr:hypothetical protein B0A50_02826 [Salinomyces thailandica]
MAAAAEIHGDKSVSCPEHVTSTPTTTLTVKQKYWSYFKSTGRGFTVTNASSDNNDNNNNNNDDNPLLFALSTKSFGKRRCLEDTTGKALFNLERNWLSRRKAWVLKDPEGNTVFTVRLRWSKFRIKMEVEWKGLNPPGGGESGGTRGGGVTVEGENVWHERVRMLDGGCLMAEMRCTNTVGGILSSYKVTPPVWEVQVREGVDLALVTVLAVCVSDIFSEGRVYMV